MRICHEHDDMKELRKEMAVFTKLTVMVMCDGDVMVKAFDLINV